MCMKIPTTTSIDDATYNARTAGKPDDVIRAYKVYIQLRAALSSPWWGNSPGGRIYGPGRLVSNRAQPRTTYEEQESRRISRGLHVATTRAAAESYLQYLRNSERMTGLVIVPVTYQRQHLVGVGVDDLTGVSMAVVTELTISQNAFKTAMKAF